MFIQPNEEHTDAQQQLKRAQQEVKNMGNSNFPMDSLIVDVVIALRLFGLPTESSCQGHLEPLGHAYPYVSFYIEKRNDSAETLRKWYDESVQHRNKLKALLEEFYSIRPHYFQTEMYVTRFNRYGMFYLMHRWARHDDDYLSNQEITERMEKRQNEMRAFSEYLISKHLNGENQSQRYACLPIHS